MKSRGRATIKEKISYRVWRFRSVNTAFNSSISWDFPSGSGLFVSVNMNNGNLRREQNAFQEGDSGDNFPVPLLGIRPYSVVFR